MYAHDIALTDEDKQALEHKVNQPKGSLANGGLKLNVAKTEYMACRSTDPDPIKMVTILPRKIANPGTISIV
jgi:hypothetical protein